MQRSWHYRYVREAALSGGRRRLRVLGSIGHDGGSFVVIWELIAHAYIYAQRGDETLRIHHHRYSPECMRVSRRLPDSSCSGIDFSQLHRKSSRFSLLLTIPLPVFILFTLYPSCHYRRVITTPYPSPQLYHIPSPAVWDPSPSSPPCFYTL